MLCQIADVGDSAALPKCRTELPNYYRNQSFRQNLLNDKPISAIRWYGYHAKLPILEVRQLFRHAVPNCRISEIGSLVLELLWIAEFGIPAVWPTLRIAELPTLYYSAILFCRIAGFVISAIHQHRQHSCANFTDMPCRNAKFPISSVRQSCQYGVPNCRSVVWQLCR